MLLHRNRIGRDGEVRKKKIDIHPDSDITVIYSNTKKYEVPENDDGSVMIGSLSKVIKNTDLCTHDLSHIATMLNHEVSMRSSLLCVELVTRNKYLIYLKERTTQGRIVINDHEMKDEELKIAELDGLDDDEEKDKDAENERLKRENEELPSAKSVDSMIIARIKHLGNVLISISYPVLSLPVS